MAEDLIHYNKLALKGLLWDLLPRYGSPTAVEESEEGSAIVARLRQIRMLEQRAAADRAMNSVPVDGWTW